MAEDIIVNPDTQTGDKSNQDLEGLDATALAELITTERTANTETLDKNKQLFERAKTAEGFEKQEDGSWTKTVEKTKVVKEPKAKKTEADTLDYGQLAFHNSKSDSVKIEHEDDMEFLKETLEETGKDQQSILNSDWFNAELKSRQEARTVKDATPKGGRGSGETPSTKADFWIKKGELPEDTPENRELRIEVVNARMKIEANQAKFAPRAVVD